MSRAFQRVSEAFQVMSKVFQVVLRSLRSISGRKAQGYVEVSRTFKVSGVLRDHKVFKGSSGTLQDLRGVSVGLRGVLANLRGVSEVSGGPGDLRGVSKNSQGSHLRSRRCYGHFKGC